MSTNTLNNRASGEGILAGFFNDIHSALEDDLVGRASSGVPTAGKNLGTVALPWGTVRANSLVLSGSTVDPTLITAPQNIVLSGKVRTTSNQPAFITPNGAALSFVLDGTPTNLLLDINGSSVSVTTDITKSSLTAAPSTNNTALINDTTAADQNDTRRWGEHEHYKSIIMDTAGSEITALIGQIAAFKIAGVTNEYFIAFVKSATELTNCFRGFFYDSALAPIKRTGFSNNDTLQLMKLGWVFVENDATTIDVTYTNPKWSVTAPGSPATGDYWYDIPNALWKRYDGASFVIINRTFVGMIINDTTACVGARCIDFYAKYSAENTIDLGVTTTSIINSTEIGQRVNVAGNVIDFGSSFANWNITTDRATAADMYSATEDASTMYYLYLTDLGEEILSDIEPYYRADLLGHYHPHNPWRCVGAAFNDASSDLNTVRNGGAEPSYVEFYGRAGVGSSGTAIRTFTGFDAAGGDLQPVQDAVDGDYVLVKRSGYYCVRSLDIGAINELLFNSVNQVTLTATAAALSRPEFLSLDVVPAASQYVNTGISRHFAAGDKIRHGVSSGMTGSGTTVVECHMKVERLSGRP